MPDLLLGLSRTGIPACLAEPIGTLHYYDEAALEYASAAFFCLFGFHGDHARLSHPEGTDE